MFTKVPFKHVPTRGDYLWGFTFLLWALFSLWLWKQYRLAPKDPAQDPAFHYLLSALSQGMAALFGLIFTVSLVAAQLTSRYSHRLLKHIFSFYTITYIGLFIVAIILPLLFLPSPNPWKVKLCLSLGALALLLLIPYFRYFLDRLTPRSLLETLFQESFKRLRAKNRIDQIESIQAIDLSLIHI